MAYQNNPGQGVMFPNDQQGNPARPTWRGSVNINGKEYEISAWDKTSSRGNRYLSLDVREPRPMQQQAPYQQAPQQKYQQQQPRQQRQAPKQQQGEQKVGDMPF